MSIKLLNLINSDFTHPLAFYCLIKFPPCSIWGVLFLAQWRALEGTLARTEFSRMHQTLSHWAVLSWKQTKPPAPWSWDCSRSSTACSHRERGRPVVAPWPSKWIAPARLAPHPGTQQAVYRVWLICLLEVEMPVAWFALHISTWVWAVSSAGISRILAGTTTCNLPSGMWSPSLPVDTTSNRVRRWPSRTADTRALLLPSQRLGRETWKRGQRYNSSWLGKREECQWQ
jgi:hypothetical protein